MVGACSLSRMARSVRKPRPHPLRDWLSREGWTQYKLALAVGCSPTLLCDIIQGRRTAKLRLAIKIHEVTGIAIERLAA